MLAELDVFAYQSSAMVYEWASAGPLAAYAVAALLMQYAPTWLPTNLARRAS
jgi:hypothetical protein